MTTYYALIGSSRNACGNVRWNATAYNTEKDVIGYATNECDKQGTTLEDLAGIEWVGVDPDQDGEYASFKPSREFEKGEEFAIALEKLNDDGRTFNIYDDSDDAQIECFLRDAEECGLGERAKDLVY